MSALPTVLMWLLNHILFSLLMIIPHGIQCDLISKQGDFVFFLLILHLTMSI